MTAGDCGSVIRVSGQLYASYSTTRADGAAYAEADVAECHDVGRDAPGSVFPDDPKRVLARTVEGYGADEVLLVSFERAGYRDGRSAVFIADSFTVEERARIIRELRRRP